MSRSEQESTGEQERKIREVFDAIVNRHRGDKGAKAEKPEEWQAERLEGLPERARNNVVDYDRRLKEAGVEDASKRTGLVDEKILTYEQTYQDRRFTVGEGEYMLKKEYAKEQAIDWIREILDNQPSPDDLKKIALLNFDANGLKAVNDLSASHDKGTDYLRRIAEVFHAKDGRTAKWLKAQGIVDILDVTAGGDEYSVVIKSEKPIPPEVISRAIRMFEEDIAALDVADLIDFDDPMVRLRYLGISEKEFSLKSEEERKALSVRALQEIPEGFKMRSSAPGGGATLFDGLLTAMRHETKSLTEEDSYAKSLDKMMGGLWDAADKSALENKNVYKESLKAEGASEEDQFYSKVLARTSEARVLEAKIDSLALKIRKMEAFQKELEELDRMLEEGLISPKEYVRTKKEKQKALEQPG